MAFNSGAATGPAGYTVDDEILDFLYRWQTYGAGPVEDIFVQLGLSTHEFFSRAADLLAGTESGRCAPAITVEMQRTCRARLWTGQ